MDLSLLGSRAKNAARDLRTTDDQKKTEALEMIASALLAGKRRFSGKIKRTPKRQPLHSRLPCWIGLL